MPAAREPHPSDASAVSTQAAQVQRVFWITLGFNLLVAGGKIGWGLFSRSLSLTADGFHSLLDGVSNVVGLIGIRIASKPPDANHPYGHRKFEAFAALIISFFIFGTCFQILKEAVEPLFAGPQPGPAVTPVSYAVVLGTLAINVFVTRYQQAMGRKLNSSLLLADAAHTQSDVWVTTGVLASLAATQLGFAWVDTAMALAIAVVVFRAGYQIIMRHLGALTDEIVIDRNLVEPVVLATEGVISCHRIRTRGLAEQVFMDLHIQVDADMPLRQAHGIAHRVEDALKRTFDGVHSPYHVVDVVVHVEEAGDDDPEPAA